MEEHKTTTPIAFSDEELRQIEEIKSRYYHPKAAIMPVLWMAQKKWGWLSTEVMKYVAEVLGLPPAHVMGVARFYSMYFKKPMGKFHIQVCTNVSCMLRGAYEIWDYLREKYKIENLERTEDGLVSLEEVECMGACGGAPMIAINEDYYENLTLEKLEEILQKVVHSSEGDPHG